MADNFGGDEFYNFNYDQQQQQSAGYDMGGNNFGQDPQFAQFDYGQQQQGYGDQNAYGGNRDQYAGHIFTPEPVQQYDPNTGGENYDEEPPLMEELGINFDHIMQKMALNFEKLLNDAKILVTRLKTHDSSADVIIAQTQTLHNRIDSMKQYQDDINELNEIARHRPRSTLVLGIAQENRQIRELQQENKELCLSLEEHQSALELIMQKYREQIMKLLQSNRVEKSIKTRQDQKNREIEQLIDKISEMAAVMQKAASVDDQLSAHDHEKLTQLQLENNGLREILEVCTTAKQKILDNVKATESDDKSAQTDQSSDQSFESLDSQGENEPVNKPSEND